MALVQVYRYQHPSVLSDERLSLATSGGMEEHPLGSCLELWTCAARARSPLGDIPSLEAAFPGLGPDAGRAAGYSLAIEREESWFNVRVDIEPPLTEAARQPLPVRLNRHKEMASLLEVRTQATLWPENLRPFLAHGLWQLTHNLRFGEARWQNIGFLEPLLRPELALEPLSLRLLCVGLACKDVGEAALATDIAISAVSQGRLRGAALGAEMAELLPTGLVVPARWARTLEEVASVSPHHREEVFAALERALRGEPPKGAHALLELMLELSVQGGLRVQDSESRAYLTGFSGSSKAARAARALLNDRLSASCSGSAPRDGSHPTFEVK